MTVGKSLGTYTARGTITEELTRAGIPQRIRLFDGSFSTGYKVTKFQLVPYDFTFNTTTEGVGKLATSPNAKTSLEGFCDLSDSREIAWSGVNGSAGGSWDQETSLVDADNLVIEDLWVYALTIGTDTQPINFYIEMEKFEISEAQGALTMSRDRANESEAEWTN